MSESDPLLQAAAFALMSAFLAQSNNDPALARQAALAAILSHHPANGAEALLAAQAIAFGLAAVQASAHAIANPETPNIRAATSLARTAERCQRVLNARKSTIPPQSKTQETQDYDSADAPTDVAAELPRNPIAPVPQSEPALPAASNPHRDADARSLGADPRPMPVSAADRHQRHGELHPGRAIAR